MTARSIASLGLLDGVKGIAAVGYLGGSPGKLPMGGWPTYTTPYLRTRPPPSVAVPQKAVSITVEDVFRPGKQPYQGLAEIAAAPLPFTPEAYPGELGSLLAQLAAGRPVIGSPGELAAIREVLRRNQALLDQLEADRLLRIKRQRDMAALLMLMMEM